MHDLIIIGGGIAGLTLAYRFRNTCNVLLLEKNDYFSGTTSQSLAGFSLSYSPALFAPYLEKCLNFYSQLNSNILHKRGRLIVVNEDKNINLNSNLIKIDDLKFLTNYNISSNAIAALRDFFDFNQFKTQYFEKNYFDVNIECIKEELLSACNACTNITLHHFEPALAIKYQKNLWEVKTAFNTFKAPIIVNALGPWSDTLFNNALIHLKRNRYDCAHVSFVDLPAILNLLPAITDEKMNFFIKPNWQHCNEFILSSQHTEKLFNGSNDDPIADKNTLDKMLQILKLVTFGRESIIKDSWIGIKIITADQLPIIGFDVIKKGLFWYNGFAGYGNKLAPSFSKMAYEIITGQIKPKDQPIINQLSPGRFYDEITEINATNFKPQQR